MQQRWPSRWQWLAIMAGLLILLGLLGAAVYFLPPILIQRDGADANTYLKAVTDTRTALVQAVGGIGVFAAAVVGLLTLLHNRQAHRQTLDANVRQHHETLQANRASLEQTLEANRQSLIETLALTSRGQVTERFTNAIDQLGQSGAGKLDVRLGGIYALEQIARDSQDLAWPITEVLMAFVREHAPIDLERIRAQDDASRMKVAVDVQAALTVLGRRSPDEDRGRLDLHETNLDGANLDEAELAGAALNGALLADASLKDANLEGADLQNAYLVLAILRGANLTAATLDLASLKLADLTGATLKGAHLSSCDLEGASLNHANLAGIIGPAFLGAARLQGTNLTGATLAFSDLKDADLQDADLSRVTLGVGSLVADLAGARLEGTKLEKTDLRGIDLSLVEGLNQAQLDQAITNNQTIPPPGLTIRPNVGKRGARVRDVTPVAHLEITEQRGVQGRADPARNEHGGGPPHKPGPPSTGLPSLGKE